MRGKMGGVAVHWTGVRPGRTTAEERARLSRQTTSYWGLIVPRGPEETLIKASSLRADSL